MFGVGEFEQFDWRLVFDDERDADTLGRAVRRNQDFAASKLGGKVVHFKRDVWHSPDQIGNRRVRFKAHPFHAEFAFLAADDKEFQMLQVGLPRLRFGSGNPDVGDTGAFLFSLPRIGANSTLFVTSFELALVQEHSVPVLPACPEHGVEKRGLYRWRALLQYCRQHGPFAVSPVGGLECSVLPVIRAVTGGLV